MTGMLLIGNLCGQCFPMLVTTWGPVVWLTLNPKTPIPITAVLKGHNFPYPYSVTMGNLVSGLQCRSLYKEGSPLCSCVLTSSCTVESLQALETTE